MKKAVFIALILFIAADIFACSCAVSNVPENFMRAEIVVRADIQKVYPNSSKENNYYKVEIEPIEVYKGQAVSSLEIYGTSDGELFRTSCDLYVPENTEWLIYASTNVHGNMSFHMCSGSQQIDREINQDKYSHAQENFNYAIERELEILKFFKNKNIAIQNAIHIYEDGSLYESLEKYAGIHLNKNFALFEITFNADVTVNTIRNLSGFNPKLDKELISILRNCKWGSYHNGIENKVPKDTKWLIGIYFYEEEDGTQNFLSQFTL